VYKNLDHGQISGKKWQVQARLIQFSVEIFMLCGCDPWDFGEFLCLVPHKFGPVYVGKWIQTVYCFKICYPWKPGGFGHIFSLNIWPHIFREIDSRLLCWHLSDDTEENRNTQCPCPGSD
jgi:hypothetical protein